MESVTPENSDKEPEDSTLLRKIRKARILSLSVAIMTLIPIGLYFLPRDLTGFILLGLFSLIASYNLLIQHLFGRDIFDEIEKRRILKGYIEPSLEVALSQPFRSSYDAINAANGFGGGTNGVHYRSPMHEKTSLDLYNSINR